jgi:hypothetical protein
MYVIMSVGTIRRWHPGLARLDGRCREGRFPARDVGKDDLRT